ncbi:MAG: adenosine deaminase [Bdellovibrionaceae bacterium]|nr:adenosine deaminase [Pseudobdellovibrionaceae bacterium]
MSSLLSIQEIRSLPKIDLHRHLDCSMRWSTMLEIASTLKMDFPQSSQAQYDHFLVTKPMNNLEQVLNKFLISQKLLGSTEILERLAFEACEDAFNDGIRILELRYAPTYIADGHSHLTYESIHAVFLKGIAKAQEKFPMAVGLICIIQRNLPLEKAALVTDFAIENKKTFLALDLADNEEGFEPKKFAPLFQKAKIAGLEITVHSGESPSPQAGNWVRDSIEILGATRIGHGVQSIHFPEVIKLLKEKNVLLEVCPYSNYLTQAFKTYKENPLKKLKDFGVAVAISSDDPGMFASVLSDDYLIAQNELGFTSKDFQDCNQSAFNHSFISLTEKRRVWSL